MTTRDSDTLRALGMLIDGSHLAEPDQLVQVVDDAVASLGWSATVYLADFSQRWLKPLGHSGPQIHYESVDGSLAGRCFRRSHPVASRAEDHHVWIPLIDGVDRLGVIRLELAPGETMHDPSVAAHVRWVAQLTGHLIATKAAYTDFFHIARQSRQRSTSSELIWSLLPPLTIAAEGIAISGGLEPNHAIAGDIFDYAIGDHIAHLAIADATGHDLDATLMGALILAAYRAGRRREDDLPGVVAGIDAALCVLAENAYASGFFAQLDIRTGVLRYANAGHHAPLIVRRGKVVKSLEGGRRILLGFSGREVPVATETLERGDWLVLYTDGVTEARDVDGQMFGLERLVDIVQRCAADRQIAAETLRRIVSAVLDHQRGVLQDDATLVVVQWMTSLEHEIAAV